MYILVPIFSRVQRTDHAVVLPTPMTVTEVLLHYRTTVTQPTVAVISPGLERPAGHLSNGAGDHRFNGRL